MKVNGSAPRVSSLDDYFLEEEEEQVEDPDQPGVKTSRFKYKYDVEMIETYNKSALKTFQKTLVDGYFSFALVDNINARVCDFNPYCVMASNAGWNVYICETEEKDLQVLAKKNLHGWCVQDLKGLEAIWEPTPINMIQLRMGDLLQKEIFSLSNISESTMEEDEADKETDPSTTPLPSIRIQQFIEEQSKQDTHEDILPLTRLPQSPPDTSGQDIIQQRKETSTRWDDDEGPSPKRTRDDRDGPYSRASPPPKKLKRDTPTPTQTKSILRKKVEAPITTEVEEGGVLSSLFSGYGSDDGEVNSTKSPNLRVTFQENDPPRSRSKKYQLAEEKYQKRAKHESRRDL